MKNIISHLICHAVFLMSFEQLNICAIKRSEEETRQSSIGDLFMGKNVLGGIIQTNPKTASLLGRDFHKVPQGVNGSAEYNAQLRIKNSHNMINQLPFHVNIWWSIYAAPCPNRPSRGNDRGVAMAHHQIWADYEYHGTRGSYKDYAKDNDILVVFEDDAVITVNNITHALATELSSMTTDLLFLGWCYGRRQMPMCTHAYALTRAGVKKLLSDWNGCHIQSIDGQWKHMVNRNIITYRKAHSSTYASDVKLGFEDKDYYFTRGVFIQKGGLVSFNHHGFQNNANTD